MTMVSPASSRASVDSALGPDLDRSERVRFWARVDRSLSDITALVDALYGAVVPTADLVQTLVLEAATALGHRDADLRDLDARREVDPEWFQRPDRIGYVAYADKFGGDLLGVARRVDYLRELGVTYLHLMNVLATRDGANDGGFAVLDYGEVQPRLGTRQDLRRLAATLRAEGISLCLDVVMNHTAAEHAWAQAARAGSVQHRDYYLTYPDRSLPDSFERTLPEVFPEMSPGNFTYDEGLGRWVWTTFNSYQWDLNYANPRVFVEMLRIVLDLAALGVDVMRLDAIAFTWKRLGTDCQNQPEAHLIAQLFRAVVGLAAPGVLLKAEAIVAPDDLVPYLGVHRTERRECHLAYHNQLMVMIWSSLATGSGTLAAEALANLPHAPHHAAWCNYLRCHDDIGWAVDDADAAAVGLSGAAHRRFLAEWFRGDHPGSPSRGAAFSVNESNGDERTCGSAAALCGITDALARSDEAALDVAISRLLVGYGIVVGFPGIPLVYMGDEIALGNDESYLLSPETADDSRWMHRPPMDWQAVSRRLVEGTVEQRVYEGMHTLLDVKRRTPAMTAGGRTYIQRHDEPGVLVWVTEHDRHGVFLGLANVSERTVTLPADMFGWARISHPVELLGTALDRTDTRIVVPRLSVSWFVDAAAPTVDPAPPRPREAGRP